MTELELSGGKSSSELEAETIAMWEKNIKRARKRGRPFLFFLLSEAGIDLEKTPVVDGLVATTVLTVDTRDSVHVFCVPKQADHKALRYATTVTDGGVLTVRKAGELQPITVYGPAGWLSYELAYGATVES